MKAREVLAACVACLLAIGLLAGCGIDWANILGRDMPLRPAPRPAPRPVPQPAPQPAPPAEESLTGYRADTTVPFREDYPVVVMETSEGTIRIELWHDRAPRTVANFLEYVDAGFYDGTIFHRVIDGFMIQGGGFTPDMQPKPTRPPIKCEASAELRNMTGTIAMARGSGIDSATSQFFINVANNAFLDHRDNTPEGFGHAVFGRVVEGTHVLDRVRSVPTGRRGLYEDVPLTPVLIKSIRRAPRP